LTVPAGIGVVLDRKVDLTLADSQYTFRMIRGPEYRIIRGNFTLERTSLDAKTVLLPRMTDMLAHGWTSGDCCVATSKYSLPLRMAAEDLHVAGVLGHVDAKPIPRRSSDDPIENDPCWIREDLIHHDGMVVYGASPPPVADRLPIEWLADLKDQDEIKIAIENPFAWQLPVWLASGQVDGFFLLGDWLRLATRSQNDAGQRGPQSQTPKYWRRHRSRSLGRENLLEHARSGAKNSTASRQWQRRRIDTGWIQPFVRRHLITTRFIR